MATLLSEEVTLVYATAILFYFRWRYKRVEYRAGFKPAGSFMV
jgi:hypothetical protein